MGFFRLSREFGSRRGGDKVFLENSTKDACVFMSENLCKYMTMCIFFPHKKHRYWTFLQKPKTVLIIFFISMFKDLFKGFYVNTI